MNAFFHSVKNKFGTIYIFSALMSLSSVALSFISVSVAGYEEYGLFVLLMSLVGVMLDVVSSRTSEGVTYFYKLDKEKRNVIFSGCVFDLFVALFFLIAISIFYFNYEKIESLSKINKEAVVLYAIYPFFRILFGTTQGYLIAIGNYKKIVVLNFLSSTIRLLVTIVLVFYGELDHVLIALTYALSALVFIPHIYSVIKLSKFWKFNEKEVVRGFFKYSIKTFFSTLVKSGNKKIDNLIVGLILGPSFLSLYDLCKKLLLPINFLVSPLANVYFPDFISNYSLGNFQNIIEVIKKSSFYILLIQTLFASFTIFSIFFFSSIFFDGYKEDDILRVYFTVLLSFSFTQHTWWCRPFSNSVNPNMSLIANLLMTIGYFLIVIPFTMYFNRNGFLLSITVINLLLFLFWFYLLRKRLK